MKELHQIQLNLFFFDHSDIYRGLEIAQCIRGLGIPGASGLLSILFPKDFGTVDQFVVKSLQSIPGLPEQDRISKINPDFIKLDDGLELISLLRNEANQLNKAFKTNTWTPRSIDKVLWSYRRN